MYQTNSFDKLATTPYVSKYVGNTLQEQSQTLERLQGRYDAGLALENQMTRIVNSIPFDKAEEHLRQPMLDYYNSKLQEYAQTGDYHRNLAKIQSDAAMIESYYKTATSRAELAQKQREAVMKTKAPDAVKQMYASRVIAPGSKFTPAGFQFSSINPNLPADFIDVEKEALNRADEIKIVSKKLGQHLTEEERAGYFRQLGIDPTQGLLKQVEEASQRDPAAVRRIISSALVNNPEWSAVINQGAEARVFNLSEETVDGALSSLVKNEMQAYPPEVLAELDLETKKKLLSQEVADSERARILEVVETSKSGTISYSLDRMISSIPGGKGGGSRNFPIEGVSYASSGSAILSDAWSVDSHVGSIAEITKALNTPGDEGGPRGTQRAQYQRELQEATNLLKNTLSKIADSPEFMKELEATISNSIPRMSTVSTETNRIRNFYLSAQRAGVRGFESFPTKMVDGKEMTDWAGATQRILKNFDPSWVDVTGADRNKQLLADAVNSLFYDKDDTGKKARNSVFGSLIQKQLTGGKTEVETIYRYMESGIYDKLNEAVTGRVMSAPNDFSVVEATDANGTPKFGRQTVDEYLSKLDRSAFDVAKAKIKYPERNVLGDRSSFVLVVPSKTGKEPATVLIASGIEGHTYPELNTLLEENVRDLSRGKPLDAQGNPQFNSEADNNAYRRSLFQVVTAKYSRELRLLNSFAAVDNQEDIIISIPVEGEKGTIYLKTEIDKILDDKNSTTGNYIYQAKLFNQDGSVKKYISGGTPEQLLYNIDIALKQAK